jgi:hypothetical protein
MTTESADGTVRAPRHRPRVSVEELARRKGVRPVASVSDMAQEGVFDSDEELEEFIAYTYANRRVDLG